jgi:hypothetical protein
MWMIRVGGSSADSKQTGQGLTLLMHCVKKSGTFMRAEHVLFVSLGICEAIRTLRILPGFASESDSQRGASAFDTEVARRHAGVHRR